MDDALAAQAHAPHEVIFGCCIVDGGFCLAGSEDALRPQDDVFLEAAAADGANGWVAFEH
jgi:hypothetical protein